MFRHRSVGRSPGGWSCGGNYGNRREVAHGEGVRGEGRQKGSKWGVWRRDRVGEVTCLMDAVVGGRDTDGVGDSGCRFGGNGKGRGMWSGGEVGGGVGAKALADVHQNSAQQIPSSPTRWIASEWVGGCVADAPNEVVWAGLNKVQLACFHECSAQV